MNSQVGIDSIDFDHVVVVNLGHGLGFTSEPSNEVVLLCQLFGEYLQSNGPVQTDLSGQKYLPHPALAQTAFELEVTQSRHRLLPVV